MATKTTSHLQHKLLHSKDISGRTMALHNLNRYVEFEEARISHGEVETENDMMRTHGS